jgi:hypothetical protein
MLERERQARLLSQATRRIPGRRACVAMTLLVCICWSCAAQTTSPTQPGQASATSDNDTDPTKPVFLSFRHEYVNLLGGAWGMATVLRADQAILKNRKISGKTGILLRFDAPLIQISGGASTSVGLGDIYGQAIYIPHIRKTLAFATGIGLVVPTATEKALGEGKWKLAPLAAPVLFLGRRGFFFVKLQDTFSFAGPSSRPDAHYLQTTPTVLLRVSRRFWLVADTDIKTNWKLANATGFKSSLQIGRMLNSRFGLSLRPEVYWGRNREGDWALKVIMIWVRA